MLFLWHNGGIGNSGSDDMGHQKKPREDDVLPEFGVSKRVLEADVRRRIASLVAGRGATTEQVRARFRDKRAAESVKGRRAKS